MTEGKPTSFRCPPELVEPLERATRDQTRTTSHQLVHYLRQGLERDGYLPPTQPPQAASASADE